MVTPIQQRADGNIIATAAGSIDTLIRHVTAGNTKEALQYIKQVPEKERAAFVEHYPIENIHSEEFIRALFDDKETDILQLLLERACKENPSWWKENSKLHTELLSKAVDLQVKPLAELLVKEGLIDWIYDEDDDQTWKGESLVKAALAAKFESVIVTLLQKIVPLLWQDETYMCFQSLYDVCPKALFEQLVDEAFQNNIFLQSLEARVVLTLLFRIERFDLGTKYFNQIRALNPKPQWLLKYDGPDENEMWSWISTWNSTLFVAVCKCMKKHPAFVEEGTAIAFELSTVINPFDEGRKCYSDDDDLGHAMNPLRLAAENGWKSMIESFFHCPHCPERESINNLNSVTLEGVTPIYDFLKEHLGEEYTNQLYENLDLNNRSTYEFLLDLLPNHENIKETLALCEKLEAASPPWWNDTTKANCFRYALYQGEQQVAAWFLPKIPDGYEYLDGLWVDFFIEPVTETAEERFTYAVQIDISETIKHGYTDILEKLCQKQIAYCQKLLSEEQHPQNSATVRNICFALAEIDINDSDILDEKHLDECYNILYNTLKNSAFEWLQSYNNLWKALRGNDFTTAATIFTQEARKEPRPAWIEDPERILNICYRAIEKNAVNMLAACIPFIGAKINKITVSIVHQKKIECLFQLAASGIDFFEKGRKIKVWDLNKHADSILEYIEMKFTKDEVIDILSKMPIQETTVCKQIKSLLLQKKKNIAMLLTRRVYMLLSSEKDPNKKVALATELLETVFLEPQFKDLLHQLVKMGASLSKKCDDQKSIIQKIEELYGSFFVMRLLNEAWIYSANYAVELFEDLFTRGKKNQVTLLAAKIITDPVWFAKPGLLQPILKCLLLHDALEEATAFFEQILATNGSFIEIVNQGPRLFSLINSKLPRQARTLIETCSLSYDRKELLKMLIQDHFDEFASLLFHRLYSQETKPTWWTKEVLSELFFCAAPFVKNETIKDIANTLFHDPLLEIKTTSKGNPLLTAIQTGFEKEDIEKALKTRFSIALTEQQLKKVMKAAATPQTPLSLSLSLDILGNTVTTRPQVQKMPFIERYETIETTLDLGLLNTTHEKSLIAHLFEIDSSHVSRSGLPAFVAAPAEITIAVLEELASSHAPARVETLQPFISKIKNKVADVSAPSNEGLRASFYTNIENQLLHILDYFKKNIEAVETAKTAPIAQVATRDTTAQILLKQLQKFLSECSDVGGYCSTRIQEHIRFWYVQCILKQKYDFETRIHYELASLRMMIAEGAVPVAVQNVHIYTGFLHKYGLANGIPGAESVLEDKFIRGHEQEIERIQNQFVAQYTPLTIVETVSNCIKENRELFVDYIEGMQGTQTASLLQNYWLQQLVRKQLSPIWNDATKSTEQKRTASFQILESAPWYFELTEVDGASLETLETALRSPANKKRLFFSKCEKITSSSKGCSVEGIILILFGAKICKT